MPRRHKSIKILNPFITCIYAKVTPCVIVLLANLLIKQARQNQSAACHATGDARTDDVIYGVFQGGVVRGFVSWDIVGYAEAFVASDRPEQQHAAARAVAGSHRADYLRNEVAARPHTESVFCTTHETVVSEVNRLVRIFVSSVYATRNMRAALLQPTQSPSERRRKDYRPPLH